MSEDVENTQERSAIRPRRTNADGTRAGSATSSRGRQRNATARQDADGRRRSDGADGRRRADASTRRRSEGRNRSAAAQQAPRTRKAAANNRRAASSQEHRETRRSAQRRGGVPVAVAVLLSLFCLAAGAGIAVLVTRNALLPQVKEAQQETATAKSQITTLTNELQNKTDEIEKLNKESKGSSKDDDSTDKDKKDASTGVDSPWTQSGKFTSGDSVLDTEVKAFCDARADTSMDYDSALMQVYTGVAWSEYVERDAAQHPSGKDWRAKFARMYYENDCSGNCYEFAAFLAYCLQYMGLDDAKAEGVLVQLQSGGWGDHGIVYVTYNGDSCICDTSRGTEGWMLPQSSYNVQIQDFESA